MQHHAIIITGGKEDIELCRAKALELFEPVKEGGTILNPGCTGMVGPVQIGPWNSYYSLFIAPDGSKESWEGSERGDAARKEFMDWMLKGRDLPDIDLCVDYVEITYGGDDDFLEITRSSSKDE